MLSRRDFNKLLFSTILIPSLNGCTMSRKTYGWEEGVLRLNLGFEPDTIDWAKATDSYSFDVILNIMTGLTKYNNDLKSIPSLSKSWQISRDEKKYTFFLDKEAKWSDGKTVIAQDFVYAWQRLLNPSTAAPYAYLMYPIKNAEAYNKHQIIDPSLLGVKALDDFTLLV